MIHQRENRVIFLFESELDAIAFSNEYLITSISFGSNTTRPCYSAFNHLLRTKKIIVAYDNEPSGKIGYDKFVNLMKDHFKGEIIYHPTPYDKDFGDAVENPEFDIVSWVSSVLPDAVINHFWFPYKN